MELSVTTRRPTTREVLDRWRGLCVLNGNGADAELSHATDELCTLVALLAIDREASEEVESFIETNTRPLKIAAYLARHGTIPETRPRTILGRSCASAGVFASLAHLLARQGRGRSRPAASLRVARGFLPWAIAAPAVVVDPGWVLADGAVPRSVRATHKLPWLFVLPSLALAPVASIPAMLLLLAGTLIMLLLSVPRRAPLPPALREAQTVADLCRVIGDGMTRSGARSATAHTVP